MKQSHEAGAAALQIARWKEEAFFRDPNTGVYLPLSSQREFPYSDGDEVESRLLEVVRRASDRAVGSLELSQAIVDFPSRYHLSPQRANLLRPLAELLRGRALVVGAGCGADARFVGETAKEVWAVEGSRRRATICAERCRDLENVSVFCARIEEFHPPAQFDAITLVGVLEYSRSLLGSEDGPSRLLTMCRNLLRPGGVLIVAIENLLGLKYFAGAPEDHIGVAFSNMNGGNGAPGLGPVTFGRVELVERLKDAGLPYVDFLYPFPDYKFPRLIVHPSAYRELGEDLGEMVSGTAAAESSLPFDRVFSEEMCWPAIVRNGLVEDLANSFLAVACETRADVVDENRLAYLYADMRRREYAKETILVKSANGVVARRRKLYPGLDQRGPFTQTLRDEVFIHGRLLSAEFIDVVNTPGWNERDVAACGREWIEFLKSRVMTEGFLPPDLVDCTPSNLVRAADGRLMPFDQEWTAPEPVPLPFVVFRGLFSLFLKVQSMEAPAEAVPRRIALLCRQVMTQAGIPVTSEELEGLIGRECLLQEAISGFRPAVETYLNMPLPAIRRDHRVLASLECFDNGARIVPIIRACYAAAAPRVKLRWFAPASTDSGSFFAWLNSPATIPAREPFGELPITELAAFIYGQRPDVRAAFPDLASEDRTRFTEWFLQYAASEYALDEVFLREPTAAWRRWSDARARATGHAVTRHRLEEITQQLEKLTQRFEAAEAHTADLETRLAASQAQASNLAEELDHSRAAAARELRDAEIELEQMRRTVLETEDRAAAVYTGAQRYSQMFDYIVDGYRKQRAWKVMLAVRQAYTMIVREGWKGTIRLLTGPRRPIEEYDLSFPSLNNYLPEAGSAPAFVARRRPDEPPAPRCYDIVVLAIVDFDFRFQRPQQIAAQFARNGHRVFWVTATRLLPMDEPELYRVVPLRDRIWEVHLRAPQSDPYVGVLTVEAARHFAAGLKVLYRDFAVAETVILVQLPFWRRLALELRREPPSLSLYDCMDDWDTFENLGDFNRSEEKLLAGECDILAVTAGKLQEKFAERGLPSLLARNGSDFNFFSTAEALPELSDVRRPIVGYFGAIADWIDLDLVCQVAASRPGYSFVLAGQVFGRDISGLESLANVRLLGSRPYDQMPRLLAAFDVCIIPFMLNQVTHATDPVKLYEYLSQGKPVVATDMSELRSWSDLLYLARGSEEFAQCLDRALAERDPALRQRRIEFAAANSWTARVASLDRAVRDHFPKVSVLIVSYNSAEFLGPCLRALLQDTSYPAFEVIVVDNASTDDSAKIAAEFSATDDRIRAVRLPTNTGFAAGNNAAARLATGEHLIFLNADAMVTPGWIGYLLRHLLLDRRIGLICPVTNFAGNEAKINIDYDDEATMRSFATRIARENRGAAIDIAVAPLFCALMRTDLFREIGGLDEGYGIGMFEDDDLAEAVRQRGFRVCAAEDCFVHHFGQGSFSQLASAEYNRIFDENLKRYEGRWNKKWVAHRPRPNVRPAHEEPRFSPATFCVNRSVDPRSVSQPA